MPENYSAPSYTGLEEDIDVHLQGIRLGDIYLSVCSCEQWLDQSQNIESRTDTVAGNEHLGYDWGAQCDPLPDSKWSCPNPHDPTQELPPVTDHQYLRMRAQVLNPANGWNNIENVLGAESEPVDTTQIKGNYTHDDRCGLTPLDPGDQPCVGGQTSASAALGYKLTVPIAMSNDYNGYIATYREYQRGDHYRKALTGWGPHSSDYLATRLVYLGRQLRDPSVVLPPDMVTESFYAPKTVADLAVNDARARALGETGGAAIASYEADLPDDGAPSVVDQPADVERFGGGVLEMERRLQLHRRPGGRGRAGGGAGAVGALRRPERRAAGDAEVPGGRRHAELPHRRPPVEVDGALRDLRLALRHR